MQVKKLFTLLAFLGIAASASAQEVTFTAIGGSRWGADPQGVIQNSYDKLFDNTYQKWGSTTGGGGAWFTFEASEPVVLTGYAMRTGNDDKPMNLNRCPKSWTLYGSNNESNHGKDDDTWETICEVLGNTTMDGEKLKTFYFTIDTDNETSIIERNDKAYKYYKVTIEAVRGESPDDDNVQISEFIPSYKSFSKVTLTAKAGDQWQNVDSYTHMFDGDLTTRWMSGYIVNNRPDTRNYVIFDAGSQIILNSYMLATGSDTKDFSNRNPTGWEIYGSNTANLSRDDAGWNLIIRVTGNNTLQPVNSTPFIFDITYDTDGNDENVADEAVEYRYYQFRVTGAASEGLFQLNEIALNPKDEINAHIGSATGTACTSSYTYSFAFSNGNNNYFDDGDNQQIELCDVCNAVCYNQKYTESKGFTIKDGKVFQSLIGGWGGNGKFIYTRDVSNVSSQIGTICLPYSMNAGAKTDADYYTLGRYDEDNDILLFDRVEGTLDAFTPAIYKTKGNPLPTSINLGNTSAAFSAHVIENRSTQAARGESDWAMVGTVKSGTASESGNSIYYLKGGGFYRCAENGSIKYKPYRAYITGPASANGVKAFGIADDMEDAINSITPTLTDGEVVLYDLSGRKVNDIRHGEIYIMNGRKVMFNK